MILTEYITRFLVFFFLFYFVINWFAAKQFQEIAKLKGHHGDTYFWWCFFLGLCGWAMVIALPDRANAQMQSSVSVDDLPDL